MISIFTTLLIAYSIILNPYFGVGYYFNHEECQIIYCQNDQQSHGIGRGFADK